MTAVADAVRVPFLDLQAQYRALKPEIDGAIQRVLESAQFILGPEVEALEREVAAACGVAHGVAVANGTDALELSLRALGIGPGDEVITTPFSFFACAEAALLIGATVVFADIDPVTFNIDPAAVAAKITPRTKAIIPVHLFGHPCDMDALSQLAERHHVALLEDCAQAIGARWRNRPVGSFGAAGCLSFYPTKNLGGFGDGGMIVTKDAALAERLRLLRHHGDERRYAHVLIGRNSRLDELQAAVLRVKLRYLDRWTDQRRERAAVYAELLGGTGERATSGGERVKLPVEQPGAHHVYHAYCIRVSGRDQLQQALAAQGIATQIYYPSTIPRQPALSSLPQSSERFPVAEQATREILALPMYPELTAQQQEHVARQIVRTVELS